MLRSASIDALTQRLEELQARRVGAQKSRDNAEKLLHQEDEALEKIDEQIRDIGHDLNANAEQGLSPPMCAASDIPLTVASPPWGTK